MNEKRDPAKAVFSFCGERTSNGAERMLDERPTERSEVCEDDLEAPAPAGGIYGPAGV